MNFTDKNKKYLLENLPESRTSLLLSVDNGKWDDFISFPKPMQLLTHHKVQRSPAYVLLYSYIQHSIMHNLQLLSTSIQKCNKRGRGL